MTATLRERALKAIVWAGLTVGTLDAVFAVVLYRQPAIAIFHSIASGLLGRSAYEGGAATAALGALLHYFIATTWGALYVGASSRMPILVRRWVPCGMAYGVLVYLVMNYVVQPLSRVSFARPFHLGVLQNPIWLTGLVGHMVLIGLPIAFFAQRAHAPGAR